MNQPTLHKLTLEKPIETYGWNINLSELFTPERGVHPHIFLTDKLFESSDTEFACIFYTVTEFSMGSYSGLIAIYENKQHPKLIVNPTKQWFDFQFESTLTFDKELLILRKPAYNKNQKINGCPYVIINLIEKEFAFIDFDFDSVYYNLVRIDPSTLRLELNSPKEIEISNLPNRDGELFNLNKLKYYPMEHIENCFELYKKEKTAANIG